MDEFDPKRQVIKDDTLSQNKSDIRTVPQYNQLQQAMDLDKQKVSNTPMTHPVHFLRTAVHSGLLLDS